MGPEVSMCHSFYHSLGFLLGPLQLFAYLLLYTVDLKKTIFYYLCMCLCVREKEGRCVCLCMCMYVLCVLAHVPAM